MQIFTSRILAPCSANIVLLPILSRGHSLVMSFTTLTGDWDAGLGEGENLLGACVKKCHLLGRTIAQPLVLALAVVVMLAMAVALAKR